jgi:Tol biopolymer transport system component
MTNTQTRATKRCSSAGLRLTLAVALLSVSCSRSDHRETANGSGNDAALSPSELAAEIQGTIVYERDGGIYRTEVGQTNSTRIAKSGRFPRWAPDGTKVAFVRNKAIVCVSSTGGAVFTVAKTPHARAVAWHPSGEQLLYTDGETIKLVSIQGGPKQILASGSRFAELDISKDATRLIATALRPTRLIAFDLVSGQSRELARGCSGSLSPDGALVSNNLRDHKTLALRSWETGEIISSITPNTGDRFDNQFWSNHPDWIAGMSEGKQNDIYVHRVSQNRTYRVTTCGGCNRPDLYVSRDLRSDLEH